MSVKRRMHELTAVFLYNLLLSGYKMNELLKQTTVWMNLKNILLSKSGQM